MEAAGRSRSRPRAGGAAQRRGRAQRVGPFASLVLCDNPGSMELDGTNTWLLAGPGGDTCVIVDPGPAGHPSHLDAVARAAKGAAVAVVLVTHGHADHVGGTDDLADRTDAPVRAFAADHCRGAPPLVDGEVLAVAGLRITVLHTPGHTVDSVSFLVEGAGDRAVLTGDTVLGSGTSVLDDRDGALGAYLSSLERLRGVGSARLLPGHGPTHPDLAPVVHAYRQHREQRLDQIRRHLAAHGLTAAQADARAVAEATYIDIPADLMDAATVSVRAQLAYLADPG